MNESPVDRGSQDIAVADPHADRGTRLAVAAVGLAVTATGAVAVFVTDNEAGSAAMLAVGTVLLLVGALWARVKAVKGGGMELELVEVAQRKLIAAQDAESRGDDLEAARLRAEAQELLAAARPWASQYEQWRTTLPPGAERTRLMEETMLRARESAKERRASGDPIDPAAVKTLFFAGGDGARVTALGLMQGDPALIDTDLVLDVIADSRSAFEQAHAFVIAERLSRDPTVDARTQERLLAAATAALATPRVAHSQARRGYAESIVARLGAQNRREPV